MSRERDSAPGLPGVVRNDASESAQAIEVLRSRRSIRRFSSEPIPEAILRDCIDLALVAPNSSNLQPWEFHWVRSPALKAGLIKACLNQSAARTAAELIVCVARTATWRRNRKILLAQIEAGGAAPSAVLDYYRRIVPVVYATGFLGLLAPLKWIAVSLASLFRPLPQIPITREDMVLWATKSTALACENLMLALRAYGYDSCPMEGFAEASVARLLRLSGDARVVMVLAAGKRDGEGGIWGPQYRIPREMVAFEH